MLNHSVVNLTMSGTQFDPAAVQAFLAEEATLREVVAVMCMQLHNADTSRLVNSDERN